MLKKICQSFAVLGLSMSLNAQDPQLEAYASAPEWKETKEQRLKWFKDAKFGMFIHFGLYSGAGGHWPPKTGKKYPQHYSEWIRFWDKTPEPEYGNLAKPFFTPDPGCTDEWAEVAKNAGMRYAVLTTKHHDGYTLFNAKTPYSVKNKITNSTNISPKGRDLVAEYSKSMRKKKLKVGYYYSLIDWQHPHAVPQSRPWALTKNPNHSIYTSYMNSHVKQLFTDYGKADMLWVDYSSAQFQGKHWETTKLLTDLIKLQPHMLVNNRFWNGLENDKGDFFTPEKYVPAFGSGGRAFEVCHTMNESFGYSYHDNHWKTTKETIHLLIDIVSKGGNLLLNVGPDPKGHIPKQSIKALKETGDWLKKNGSAIYGTTANPFSKLPANIRCTKKDLGNNKTVLYFHLLEWPKNNKFTVLGLQNKVAKIRLLSSKEKVSFKQDADTMQIKLPSSAINENCSVVAVLVKGKLDIATKIAARQAADRSISLDANFAVVSGPQIRVQNNAGKANIGYWVDAKAKVTMPFKVVAPGPSQAGGVVTRKPGRYKIIANYAAADNAGGRAKITTALGKEVFEVDIKSTGSWSKYKDVELGKVTLRKAGLDKITIEVAKINSAGFMNLRSIKFIPID